MHDLPCPGQCTWSWSFFVCAWGHSTWPTVTYPVQANPIGVSSLCVLADTVLDHALLVPVPWLLPLKLNWAGRWLGEHLQKARTFTTTSRWKTDEQQGDKWNMVNTLEPLKRDHAETIIVADHPVERPPWWETTPMKDHPKTIMMATTLLRDHHDDRPPW